MGTFLPSYGILFPLISKKHGKMQQNPPCELSGCFSTVWLLLLVPKSGNSLKEQTEKKQSGKLLFFKNKKKIDSRHAGIQRIIYQKKKSQKSGI